MAEIVLAARAEEGRRGRPADRDPPAQRRRRCATSRSPRPARAGACAAPSRSAGSARPTSATTRPSASSPTGSTGSASRSQAARARGRGGRHRAHRSPRQRRGLRLQARHRRRRREPRPPRRGHPPQGAPSRRDRREAIDEAMADRGETETRADVARRLDKPEIYGPRPTRSARPRTPTGPRPTRAARLTRPEVTGRRRVVVKVGSSSLTTAAGGIDPERLSAWSTSSPRPVRAAPRWCWCPQVRSRPDWPRSDWPATVGPGRPAGCRLGRSGAAGAPLHRGARAGTASSPARCC